MRNIIRGLLKDESGATAIEYSLFGSLFLVLVIAALTEAFR
jgi:Flp pilus assembly pilin Flp